MQDTKINIREFINQQLKNLNIYFTLQILNLSIHVVVHQKPQAVLVLVLD